MVNPISFPTPQAWSGGADFTPLAQLGNVYAKAQEQARQQDALSQLGQGPEADTQALLTSGVPSLAQLGLTMRSQDAARAEQIRQFNAQQAIRQAAETRAQTDWEKKDTDEEAAAKLIGGLVPGAQPAAVPAVPGATPTVPATDTSATTGTATTAARAADSLASGQPAAASGLSREQLGELYRNPLTRPLATTFLQNMLNPGTWKVEKTEDGRLVAYNEKTLQSKDITPPTPTGEPAASKQEREVQGYFQAAKKLGMSDEEARAFAANKGKNPRQDLSATEERMVEDRTKQIHAGEDVIDNLKRLQELNKTAYSGLGASKRAALLQAILPDAMVPQGAIDTTEYENTALQNVARQAKETFGARLAVAEVKLLNEIETNPLQSPSARKAILDRLGSMFQRHLADATTERESIRNKSFFKPGGGTATAPTPTTVPNTADPLGIR
jgi:hypothetical protein